MKPGKVIAAALVLAALAGGAWLALRPPAVELVSPERGPAVVAVYATGTVEPAVAASIAPQATGRIAALLAEEGQSVEAGQVLARLEDRQVRARLQELEARARFAAAEARRVEDLHDRGHASAHARDLAVSEAEAARAAAAAAAQQIADLALVSPIAGTVLRRDGDVGEVVSAGTPVFRIGQLDTLRVEARVDEEDIPLVAVGQKALVATDAFPERVFTGRVDEVTPRGDPVARSFRVRIGLPSDVPLYPGMTAEVNIIAAERADALLLPAGAVRDGAVWVVEDGRARRIPVRIGVVGDGRVEIRGGLSGETPVIADPPAGLVDGARVRE